ncbi:hypothetical protein [Amycolatopsis sp. ATCC 39116]|uniref:hypothetical protein n=1 Tax=Amycolatopsis sp. (strain ATCC 39116 / 75iv2) TaxID=385957 RepID=UPI0002FC0758|nr:hypothetical protein [Amycolatopsis sp. ATCC 39116]
MSTRTLVPAPEPLPKPTRLGPRDVLSALGMAAGVLRRRGGGMTTRTLVPAPAPLPKPTRLGPGNVLSALGIAAGVLRRRVGCGVVA